jgi:alkaline phosphatase D
MLGPVDMRTASVWIELKEGIDEATVVYWQSGKSKQAAKKVAQRKPNTSFPNIFKFQIPALEPATSYEYDVVSAKDMKVIGSGKFTTQSLWQWRTDPPDFSFLTGSCAYFNEPRFDRPGKPYGNDSSIFEAMAKEKDASFMLWLGDNWYTREVDYASEWGLNYRPSRDRSTRALQPFLKAMPQYAIWDDHDYGPDNSDKSFPLKEVSRKVFINNWMNPSYGENGQGIYTKFNYNDVDFFLLDDRWFRSNDETPDSINGKPNIEKRMFGVQQMEWFKNALRVSNTNRTVHFRVIAIGSQVLNHLSPKDCFRHYSTEFKEMMSFLDDEKINGVIFLTGDRHHSSIIKKERSGNYPLYDITASSLTAGTTKIGGLEANNPLRVLELDGTNNYTKISVSGKGPDRKLHVSFHGSKGDELRTWEVALKEISTK